MQVNLTPRGIQVTSVYYEGERMSPSTSKGKAVGEK